MWLFSIFVMGNGIPVCELVLSIFPQAQIKSIYNNERHFLIISLQDAPNKLLSMETKNGVKVNFLYIKLRKPILYDSVSKMIVNYKGTMLIVPATYCIW